MVGPRYLATLLLTLLSLCFQSLMVQAHVHDDTVPLRARAGISLGQPHFSDPSDECPICEEAAQAGAYLLPVALVVPAVTVVSYAPAIVPQIAQTPRTRSHLWRSRAPPAALLD